MQPGDRVAVETATASYEGIVMPSSTAEHLVIKGDDGYNVGITREEASVDILESGALDIDAGGEVATSVVTTDPELPTISLISTGGTIASTVDYRTGAVTSRFDAEDVLKAVPELADRANYRGRVVANILSENMTPNVWQDLAQAIYDELTEGVDGIVVMHGTDTMQYTAAAISFMVDTPVPIVFTGSQRSADRPSSDNVMNAVCAVEAAKSDLAEVVVCMHATESDNRCALHRGTRTRKHHTSRRDAFETVGRLPLGTVDFDDGTVTLRSGVKRRGASEPAIAPALESEVGLLKYVPGMDSSIYQHYEDKAGLVIEGTGLGHIHTDHIDRVAALIDGGTTVVMTSQCIEGRVCDRVYDTGRDLLEAGVIEGGDMLPETAMVKLMWALANSDDVASTMTDSLAGELTDRSAPWT